MRRASTRAAWLWSGVLPLILVTRALAQDIQEPASIPVQVLRFDSDLLLQRGLSAELADYFSRAPRFLPGEQTVDIVFNGESVGRYPVAFDHAGQPCMTDALSTALGIIVPPRADGRPPPDPACPAAKSVSPRIDIVLQPSQDTLDIRVPPEMVIVAPRASRARQGGDGAMLNYRIFDQRGIGSSSGRSRFQYLDTETGFNAGGWIARSRHNVTAIDGQTSRSWQGAYLQKTFIDERRILQAGRLTTATPHFAGLPITGLQWIPENALQVQKNFPIEGIAASRSRLELRQSGVLLYTTFVPTGFFRLTEYPVRTLIEDMEMRLVDEAGAERSVVVPAASLLLGSGGGTPQGLSLAGGALWSPQQPRTIDERTLLIASYGHRTVSGPDRSVGLLLAEGYRSLSAAAHWQPSLQSHLNGELVVADDLRTGQRGSLLSAGSAFEAGGLLNVGLSALARTRDFRNLLQAAGPYAATGRNDGTRQQVGVQLLVTEGWARGASATASRQDYFNRADSRTFSLGWATSIARATVQAGLSRSFARDEAAGGAAHTYAFVTLHLPLGDDTVSTSYGRSTGAALQSGSTLEQRVGEFVNWRASVEHTAPDDRVADTNGSLSVTVIPRYAGLTLGTSRGLGSAGAGSRFLSATGSAIVTAQGMALSALPVEDSFGLARLGRIAGLRLDTPQGPTWSGWGGMAALPRLQPFGESRVEISAKSMPTDVDVDRGLIVLEAARGAVVHLDMRARRVRRVLLSVTDALGAALPAGLAVTRNGQLVGSIGGGGQVLLDMPDEAGEEGAAVWQVLLPEGRRCALALITAVARVPDDYFDSGHAACRLP